MGKILKEAANMLLKNGYRVIAWQDDSYLPKYREGDYVSINFGKSGKIGTIRINKLSGCVEYGFSYKPSSRTGNGCKCFESGEISMEEVDRLMKMPIPDWVNRDGGRAVFYDSFDSFAKKELSFYDFKFEVIEGVDGGAGDQSDR